MRARIASRDVFAPAVVLFTVMTAHAILETARDALFLAKLGPQRLAWAYVAIAIVALAAVAAVRRWSTVRDPRRMLIGFLSSAVIGTATLATTIEIVPSTVFVLYVWTGLVATLVVPVFWTVLDRSVEVGRAKRMFAAIGAGGVLGALVGSAIAAALGRVIEPRHLVTLGALVFALATIAAMVLAPRPLAEPPPRPVTHRAISHRATRDSRRYLTLLVVLGVVSTITLTIGDLTFKRVLAERLAPEDLATVFGTIYTGLNVIGLIIQISVTPRLLAQFGVAGALTVLPIILVSSALGFALTGAWIAIIALKLGDGGLRHSLHRVTNEILFLAVPPTTRDGAKPMVDAVAQRGGQAAAALLVFAVAAIGAGAQFLAGVTAVAGGLWLVTIAVIRGAYVAQFRNMLRAGEAQRDVRVPDLDASSVDLLTEALASPDEVEALAALELLARGGGDLPALVLYHPSQNVVQRALALLDEHPEPHVAQVLGHLLESSDPQIRAATLAAAARIGTHRVELEAGLDDPDPSVRAAALVALAGDDSLSHLVGAGLAKLLDGDVHDREALARAVFNTPSERFRPMLYDLLAHREPAVMRVVMHVFARAPALADLERLLPLLADPHVRGDVRRVFVAAGERGLDRLIAALDDPRVALEVRQHIPRTISRFRTPRAAAALVARLPREPDGTTEFKILRALGRMRAEDPTLEIDEDVIRSYARRAVTDAARFATLADCIVEAHVPSTPDLELIRDLLDEKKRWSVEHAFRALGIIYPTAGVRSVYDAIDSSDDARRSAAREIFEHLAPVELREPLLAVIDTMPPDRRRAHLGDLAAGPFPTYEALLAALLAEPSASLRCIVAHHVAERHLSGLRPELARLRPLAGTTLVMNAFDQAIARLDA